jgi:spore maturation protein CgeB
MWRYLYSSDALERIGGLGIPVINISMDDRLPELWIERRGVRLGALGLANATDLVLTTSPETRSWYGAEGVPAAYFPLASDPALFSPSGEYRYEVLFVGSRYGYRERLVRTLERAGIPITVYGPGWPNGSLNGTEVAHAFSSSRIVLGVGTVAHTSHTYTLKLRDFDGPMSGALYVTHRNPDLLALYREDEEIVCYEDASDCARKLKHYLSDETNRVRIARAGLRRARAEFTWETRFASLFRRIGLLESD